MSDEPEAPEARAASELVAPVPPPDHDVRWSPDDLAALRLAKDHLEQPSFVVQLTGLLGTPIEKGFDLLPAGWSNRVEQATRLALSRALQAAVWSLGVDGQTDGGSSDRWHRLAAAATGAAGGAFGLAALPIELPVSTAIMLRSIADVARREGEALDAAATQLACLEVFALGGRSSRDDASETGYFAVRAALGRTVSDAARFVAMHGLSDPAAPALVRLIGAVAGRFGGVVGQKVAATAIPIVGGVSGALVNDAFMRHFQRMARGHFTVRRLERAYGADVVRARYEAL